MTVSSYQLFTDKANIFECKIELAGCNLSDASARMVLEVSNNFYLFKGTIDSSGKCIIPIKKLDKITQESISGKMYLEIIAEDTYFNEWSSPCELSKSKKLVVEHINIPENIPKLKISAIKTAPSMHELIIQDLLNQGINTSNLSKNKDKFKEITQKHLKNTNLEYPEIISILVKLLASKE